MRLFIASEITGAVTKVLRELQDRLGKLPGRQTFPKRFHITYQFLGDIVPDQVEVLKTALSKLKFDEISCKLEGIGIFPDESKIRVVWGKLMPADKIIALQGKIEKLTGFTLDKEFVPHITLSRVKYIENKKLFKEGVKNISKQKMEGKFSINSVKLIQSILTSKGAEYRDLLTINSNH